MVAASLYACGVCGHPEHLQQAILVGASQTSSTHVGKYCFGCPECEKSSRELRRVS